MNFVPQLRMNNIMPGGGNNPFGAPEISQPMDFSTMVNAMQAASTNRRMHDEQYEDNLHRRAMGEHLQEIARQAAMQRQGPPPMGSPGSMDTSRMNTVYGGEIPQTRVNGQTLDEARAAIDADNDANLSVKPLYQHPDDLPGSQKSRLEMLGTQIAGQQKLAGTNQANAMARQNLVGSQAKERNDADIASKEKIANESNAGKAALDAQKAKEKADADKLKADAKTAADKAKSDQKKTVINKMAQDTLTAIDDIIDQDGNLKDTVSGVVGGSRMNPLNLLPGSSGQTGNSILDNLSGKVLLNLLNEVKSQSASGATGFGNMSDKDLNTLKAAASRLNKSMPKADYAKEVARIRDGIKKMLEPSAADTGDGTKKLTAAELIKKHGG